jgi:hypothetical protein
VGPRTGNSSKTYQKLGLNQYQIRLKINAKFMLEDVMQKTQQITKMEAEMESKNVRMLEKKTGYENIQKSMRESSGMKGARRSSPPPPRVKSPVIIQ